MRLSTRTDDVGRSGVERFQLRRIAILSRHGPLAQWNLPASRRCVKQLSNTSAQPIDQAICVLAPCSRSGKPLARQGCAFQRKPSVPEAPAPPPCPARSEPVVNATICERCAGARSVMIAHRQRRQSVQLRDSPRPWPVQTRRRCRSPPRSPTRSRPLPPRSSSGRRSRTGVHRDASRARNRVTRSRRSRSAVPASSARCAPSRAQTRTAPRCRETPSSTCSHARPRYPPATPAASIDSTPSDWVASTASRMFRSAQSRPNASMSCR